MVFNIPTKLMLQLIEYYDLNHSSLKHQKKPLLVLVFETLDKTPDDIS